MNALLTLFLGKGPTLTQFLFISVVLGTSHSCVELRYKVVLKPSILNNLKYQIVQFAVGEQKKNTSFFLQRFIQYEFAVVEHKSQASLIGRLSTFI